jgi:hypothetical protein
MLVKFKATYTEVFGIPSDIYPYYEFHANVMGKALVGITKVLEIGSVDSSAYKILDIDGPLVEKAIALWPIKLESKDYVELNPSIV